MTILYLITWLIICMAWFVGLAVYYRSERNDARQHAKDLTAYYEKLLKRARKNDYRDKKGRFIKALEGE